MAHAENVVIKSRLASLKPNERLFRFNSGMAWAGKSIKFSKPTMVNVRPGDVLVKDGRPFHGAPEGFPDLAGWESVTVTPEMAGQTLAVFKGVEAKTKSYSTLSKAQKAMRAIIEKMGGVFEVVRE